MMHSGVLALALCGLLASCGSSRTRAVARDNDGGIALVAGHALVVREASRDLPVRVKPGRYVIPPLGDDGLRGVILIEGLRGGTVDLTGVDLRGTPLGTELDRNAGHGIVLRDCRDVTIRGGVLGGYKVCIAAFDCTDLVFEDVRFDGWYGARLLSTTALEDPADWLYPHRNDEREWMTNHGAAIALENCRDTTIRRSSGRHGQNGILLTRCTGTRVYDCDFSFLSGWGLALYRTNGSLVSRNRFDYCVRGYSHGEYWRGQDSAGILLFERCSDNVFALNSATHGGDGAFLFAGRDTVEGLALERGEADAGGSDRNVWWRNDFSFAVANAVEATFSSDNWVIENVLDGSHQHGVWGGYSRRMVVLDNSIKGTVGGGVSIEHGQECAIVGNVLTGNDTGLELWWDEDPELVGGPFGRSHDTGSRDHLIARNRLADNARDLVLRQTQNVWIGGDDVGAGSRALNVERSSVLLAPGEKPIEVRPLFLSRSELPSGVIVDTTLRRFVGEEPEWLVRARAWRPEEVPGDATPCERDPDRRRGLETIVMGEWGPWDFESGEPRPAQRRAGGLLATARWDAAWFRWEPVSAGLRGSGTDPREDVGRWRALAANPVERREVGAWTNPWAGDDALRQVIGADHFGIVATTRIAIEEGGTHRLSVLSDDGVRVRVDGRVELENWTWHAPTRDTAEFELAPGAHEIVLEYFQIDGAAALTVELARAAGVPQR
jgi:hypothetical protein